MITETDVAKVSVWVPISDGMARDAGWWPWKWPDPAPSFSVDLFPHLAAMGRHLTEARWRIRRAVHVLRYGR